VPDSDDQDESSTDFMTMLARRWGHIRRILVIGAVIAAFWLYYGQLSIAARSQERAPVGAAEDDIDAVFGRDHYVGKGTQSGITVVTYRFGDMSALTCRFVNEPEERRRKVLKMVPVTKHRLVYQQTGTDAWGWPIWGNVSEAYDTTELQYVDEIYQLDVPRLRSTTPSFDVSRIEQFVGIR
jgi:hypothetical protein